MFSEKTNLFIQEHLPYLYENAEPLTELACAAVLMVFGVYLLFFDKPKDKS